MQRLSLCRGPYTEKHLRFSPDFFLIWPRSRYCPLRRLAAAAGRAPRCASGVRAAPGCLATSSRGSRRHPYHTCSLNLSLRSVSHSSPGSSSNSASNASPGAESGAVVEATAPGLDQVGEAGTASPARLVSLASATAVCTQAPLHGVMLWCHNVVRVSRLAACLQATCRAGERGRGATCRSCKPP